MIDLPNELSDALSFDQLEYLADRDATLVSIDLTHDGRSPTTSYFFINEKTGNHIIAQLFDGMVQLYARVEFD
jgi:hypothetical protein